MQFLLGLTELKFTAPTGISSINFFKTIATRGATHGAGGMRTERDSLSRLPLPSWMRLAQIKSASESVHLASFRVDPIPQFTYLVERLKLHGLAYLHVIESRVNNNVDIEKTDSIDFLLDIWGNTSPVFVAGGYTPENAVLAVDEEYKNYDVAVVFGRHFLANPDLPYRIKHGLPLNKYDRASFYTPLLPVGYTDYPFSSGFIDGRAL
jgi:2,4-dienoyl-CoA reductase-like NADH-dependent reductase (Old Yellow Enzyme family)